MHSRYIHGSSSPPGGPLGGVGLPSLSVTTKGSKVHLGEGCQAFRHPPDASTPLQQRTCETELSVTVWSVPLLYWIVTVWSVRVGRRRRGASLTAEA